MKGLCILAVILALLSGCTDTGPVAPKEGRISIGGRLAQPIIESGRVSVSKPETVKNWSTSYANARNNRPHVRMAENMKCTHRVSIGKGKSDSSLTLAGPIIVDNTIYTLDSEFVLQATDLTTAKSMWRKKLADIQGTTTKSIGLSRNRDRLYAVAGNGLIVAVDFNGKEIWTKDLKVNLRSSATVDNGLLYVSSSCNKLFVLNSKTGKIIWKYEDVPSVTNFFGLGTPASADSVVIAPTTSGRVNAFDTVTGVLLWTDNMWANRTNNPLLDIAHITASPVIDNSIVYLVGNAGKTGAYLLKDGTSVFTVGLGGRETPVVSGEYLFLLTNKNKLVALNKRRGSLYWEADLSSFGKGRIWFGPVLVNGELIVTSSEGNIVFFNPTTGVEVRQEVQDQLIGAPVFAQNTMLLLTQKGDMLFYQ